MRDPSHAMYFQSIFGCVLSGGLRWEVIVYLLILVELLTVTA